MMSAKAVKSDTDKQWTPLVTASNWFMNIRCIEHISFVISTAYRGSFS